MAEVMCSIDVAVPVAAAYDQWTRFESFPQFMSGVRRVERGDDGLTHWFTEVGGVHREFDAEITETVPERRIAWATVGEGVRHSGAVDFERLGDDGTRVTVQIVWEPAGLAEQAATALGVDDRQVRADLERFKEFMEDNRVTAEEWRAEAAALPVEIEGAGAAPEAV